MIDERVGSPSDSAAAAAAAAAAAQILERSRLLVEPARRAAVDGFPGAIRHIAGYHIGWWDAEGRPAKATGKTLRSALALACAQATAVGAGGLSGLGVLGGSSGSASGPGGRVMTAAVAAAVAVELVHDFSLLHDDVMDGGLTRRHRPAAWSVFGTGQAILVGDMLLTEAVRQLSRLPDAAAAIDVLTGALGELCAGQSQDLAFEGRSDVALAECLAMAEAKTGALLGAACELGALAAGADRETARCLREFGRQLGLAFQLVDDVLGIWGDPAVTGKPVGSDLVSRKKSLPVVAALTSGTSAGRHLARWYGRLGEGGEASEADEAGETDEAGALGIERVARLVDEAGGGRWAAAEAGRRMDAALRALRRTLPDPAAVFELEVLAAMTTRREY